jgi:hypothetical protein
MSPAAYPAYPKHTSRRGQVRAMGIPLIQLKRGCKVVFAGKKQDSMALGVRADAVLPYDMSMMYAEGVRPLTGARIETKKTSGATSWSRVRPLTGARIGTAAGSG